MTPPTNGTINQAKYDATHCRFYKMKLNLDIDADIIERLASVPSMQGYIKQLIREDIKRNPMPTQKAGKEENER